MPMTIFKMPDGTRISADIATGDSVMRGALNHHVSGVEAECGGQLTCATCHVYVDTEWYDRFSPPAEAESELLEIVDSPQPNSRLSCQLVVEPNMDGLIILLPDAS